ncbi:MAG: hypothetical protein ACOH2H_19320 [Cypionkella sp.]
MRRILAALPVLFILSPLHAEPISAEIGAKGLAEVEARLTALPTRTDADTFALGGVQFLRAIEISFQDRWRSGLTDRGGILPLLRMPIPPNPAPAAFDPASVVNIFVHTGDKLAEAKATLIALPDTSDLGVEIALSDLWFDVNANATRDSGEGIADILGTAVLGAPDDSGTGPQPLPTVRFDVADAAWLAAYTDLLQAFCDMVRAFDPTEPLTRIIAAREKMISLGPVYPDMIFGPMSSDTHDLDSFDLIAVILASLNQQPDMARMASARDHLLAMVAENRLFWNRVEAETDDVQEWLPNDRQHAALGITLPQGTRESWLAVLADVEALLNGDKLLPFWRVGSPAGINLAKFYADPAPIDVPGWVQGWAALPYLERGTVIDTASLNAFDSLMQGQSMLFSLYLN